jgi:hypothetical protein
MQETMVVVVLQAKVLYCRRGLLLEGGYIVQDAFSHGLECNLS